MTRAAPARPVHLPTDTPPGARSMLGGINVAGLITHGSLGQVEVPISPAPFGPYDSVTFPLVKPSSVAPDALRPVFVVAINAYSPIAHRSRFTRLVPPKATGAGGVGVATQRPRPYAAGYVTAWPQNAPRWPTWGESPNARRG